MHHGQSRDGRAEVRYPLALERSYIHCSQVAPTEGDARHPGGDAPAGGEQNVLGNPVPQHSLLERVDFLWIAFVEQETQVAFGSEHEELVGIDHCSPQIAIAVKGDAVWPSAFP